MVVNGVIFQNFPPRGTLKGIAEKLPQNSPEKHPWSRPFLAILLLESVSRTLLRLAPPKKFPFSICRNLITCTFFRTCLKFLTDPAYILKNNPRF